MKIGFDTAENAPVLRVWISQVSLLNSFENLHYRSLSLVNTSPVVILVSLSFSHLSTLVHYDHSVYPGHDKVILDMDMLYNTEARNAFCKEWKEENGDEGEELYKQQQRRLMFRKKVIGPPGPTGTAYFAWLVKNGRMARTK